MLVSMACEVDFVPKSEAREEWKKTYTLPANGELEIENTNGKIVVRPGTGNTVEVIATRIAKAGSDEAAKKVLTDTTMTETASESSVRISSRTSRLNMSSVRYEVNYEVRAPAGVSLKLSATNGVIEVSDWNGRVEMRATNGTLTGHGLRGEVDLGTTNGRVELRLAQLSERGVKVETTNGKVTVELPKDARGRILANVSNGNISVDGLNVEASTSNTRRRYEGALNGGGPTIAIETTNGAISVRGS